MIPLVDRAADAVIGWHAGAPQTTREFLASVARVADALPTGDHIINLVRERYPFSVAFAAIIAAGKTNVLPPNDKPTVQQELAARFDGASVLHDGIDIASGVNAQRIQLDAAATDAHTTHAQIDAAHIAAIAFTSGTTGDAKPIAK
ncbi:MAG: beta-hydroxyacyl-ACP dehydratase, partial [Pseudomonadota bacterium]